MDEDMDIVLRPYRCDAGVECEFCEIYETPSGVMECNNPLSEEFGLNITRKKTLFYLIKIM